LKLKKYHTNFHYSIRRHGYGVTESFYLIFSEAKL